MIYENKRNQTQKNSYFIYKVTFTPNWLEKLFGFKEVVKEYKKTSSTYSFGGGSVYIDKSGNKLSNGNWIGEAIDKFNNQW